MAVFLFGGGLGAISLVGDRLGTQPAKIPDQEKIEKNVEKTFSVAVPTTPFSSKAERFWPLVPAIGAVCTEKT